MLIVVFMYTFDEFKYFYCEMKNNWDESTMTHQVEYSYDVNMQYNDVKHMLIYISSHQNYTNLEYRK